MNLIPGVLSSTVSKTATNLPTTKRLESHPTNNTRVTTTKKPRPGSLLRFPDASFCKKSGAKLLIRFGRKLSTQLKSPKTTPIKYQSFSFVLSTPKPTFLLFHHFIEPFNKKLILNNMETLFKIKVSIVLHFYFLLWKRKRELLHRHTIYSCVTVSEA